MELIDQITVYHNDEPRFIQLYQGDLTKISKEDAVDILVVSAFPGSYAPVTGTLIGALDEKGVWVGALAADKEADLRDSFSCWLSKKITSTRKNAEINFERIMCFEPKGDREQVPEVVGDIFQSLIAFLSNSDSLKNVAMPLVGTGNQQADLDSVLPALIEAAAHWLSLGLPVEHLKIAAYSQGSVNQAMEIFPQIKQKYHQQTLSNEKVVKDDYKYDIFISYSHQNTKEANLLVSFLKELDSKIRIFIDRKELNVGCAWQQQIYDALDSCHKVIALYSHDYLNSKVCKEEFNIALYRDRDTTENLLFPIYLYSTDLPTYMKVLQYLDCREGENAKLHNACKEILANNSKENSLQESIPRQTKEDLYSMVRELQSQMLTANKKLKEMENKLNALSQNSTEKS
ncbi:toll/interleukin-1 receptor domain-containing protein [Candidatus Uabimicrobium sp. HlEnr_7]|uniref:toll/interleukin-1 receptor domain-containing protein n=1 Tax=Candidatus Uabimicrobium helgolandensis TaxID=3095367 RepID=UPI003556BE52